MVSAGEGERRAEQLPAPGLALQRQRRRLDLGQHKASPNPLTHGDVLCLTHGNDTNSTQIAPSLPLLVQLLWQTSSMLTLVMPL
mgnify:CR=1 FL=1